MDKKFIKFDDTKIEKYKFHQHQYLILIHNKDINKIVVSNKVSFDRKVSKYFIGYKDGKKIIPFCIFLPKTSAYRRDFDKIKCMSFLVKDEILLEKYNETWSFLSLGLESSVFQNMRKSFLEKIWEIF